MIATSIVGALRELDAGDFRPATSPQPLHTREVHVWHFPRWPGPLRAVAESEPLRGLLAAYLNRPVRHVRIERGLHGKPRLRGSTLHFNLSHSGGAVLVALSRRRAVGVDLEMPHRARPVLTLAKRWFDTRETAQLAALPRASRQKAFLQLWSCKEAVLKAHGRGIGYGPQRVALALNSQGRPAELLAPRPHPGGAAWQIVLLSPGDGAVGALAWRGAAAPVHAFRALARYDRGVAANAQSG